MSIRFSTLEEELVCFFEEDITASAISGMKDQLNARLETGEEWKKLVLDIRKVERIDSLGINLIVWLYRFVRAADKDFKIINCNSQLMKLFTLFRLHTQFTIEEAKA